MDDVTWPSISSAADETMASLDRLFDRQRSLHESQRSDLASFVGRLGDSTMPWTDDSSPDPSGPVTPARRPEPAPYVHLPERTTHGGDWGPAVRRKLTAEALAKKGWR
jgi:hypothetical protein